MFNFCLFWYFYKFWFIYSSIVSTFTYPGICIFSLYSIFTKIYFIFYYLVLLLINMVLIYLNLILLSLIMVLIYLYPAFTYCDSIILINSSTITCSGSSFHTFESTFTYAEPYILILGSMISYFGSFISSFVSAFTYSIYVVPSMVLLLHILALIFLYLILSEFILVLLSKCFFLY